VQADLGNELRVECSTYILTSLTTDDVEVKTAFHEKLPSLLDGNNAFSAFFRTRTAITSTQIEIDICVIQAEF